MIGLRTIALGVFTLCCVSAHATCDLTITVGTSGADLVRDDQVAWNGCGLSGTSVQSALDHISSMGGGSLKLSGPGSLLVTSPLRIYNQTMLFGDPARTPFGMRLVGENTDATCALGGGYRHLNCPLVEIRDQYGGGMTIWNLHFDGTDAGRPLSAPAISIANSSGVDVPYNQIGGARTFGVTIRDSSNVVLRYLTLEMVRKTGAEPEGGAGVWNKQSTSTVLENSNISGYQYYAAGLPQGDPGAPPGAAPTMDLVASYGSSGTVIRHNVISYGNTAGIYFAACEVASVCNPSGYSVARESGSTVWDNDVAAFRQHGVDVANTDASAFLANRISSAGYAALSLADSHGNDVRYNVLQSAVQNGTPQMGALYFLWGASNNSVSANNIHGTGAPFAVFFAGSGAPPYTALPLNNTVTNNSLWTGNSGYFGGGTAGNTISPNTLY